MTIFKLKDKCMYIIAFFRIKEVSYFNLEGKQLLSCTHICASLPLTAAVGPVMQNANVNFAGRATLMPRSPWLAEKEQKDQVKCLHV